MFLCIVISHFHGMGYSSNLLSELIKFNGGTSGIDGVSFEDIEIYGVSKYLNFRT